MPSLLNPYVLLGLLVSGVCIFGSGVYTGARWADRKAEIAALEQGIHQRDAVIAEHQRQAEALKDVTEQAERRASLAEQAAIENSQEVERYSAELAARPEPVCAFNADDVRVLNSLARARGRAPVPPTVSR